MVEPRGTTEGPQQVQSRHLVRKTHPQHHAFGITHGDHVQFQLAGAQQCVLDFVSHRPAAISGDDPIGVGQPYGRVGRGNSQPESPSFAGQGEQDFRKVSPVDEKRRVAAVKRPIEAVRPVGYDELATLGSIAHRPGKPRKPFPVWFTRRQAILVNRQVAGEVGGVEFLATVAGIDGHGRRRHGQVVSSYQRSVGGILQHVHVAAGRSVEHVKVPVAIQRDGPRRGGFALCGGELAEQLAFKVHLEDDGRLAVHDPEAGPGGSDRAGIPFDRMVDAAHRPTVDGQHGHEVTRAGGDELLRRRRPVP